MFLYTSCHDFCEPWALLTSWVPSSRKTLTAAFCFPIVSQCSRTEDEGGNSRMVKYIHSRTRCDPDKHLVRSPCCCCCSVARLRPTLCDPMDCSTPGSPVLHHLLELAQTHVHWVSDAIQPSGPLLSPFPPAINLSQHLGLFQWIGSSRQVAKVLELQLQHHSLQWIFRVDFL